MNALKISLTSLSLVCAVGLASAQTVKVPQDFGTIQEAIDGAADGDTIQISSGTYDEAVVVDGRDGLTLKGKGKVVINGGGADHTITVNDSTTISIEKLRVTGGAFTGAMVTASTTVTISRCRFLGNTADNIRASNTTGLFVEKNSILGGSGYGVHSEGGDSILVTKNRISFVGLDGIRVATATTDAPKGLPLAEVSKNRVAGAGDDGIEVLGSNILVSKNRVIVVGDDGIEVEGVLPEAGDDFITIEKNVVRLAASDGLNLNGQGVTAEKNNIVMAGDNGIRIDGGGRNTILKNRVVRAGDDGIETKAGLEEGGTADASDNHIEKNSVRRSDEDGLDIESTGNTLVKNVVAKSGSNGVLVQGSNNAFTRNKARKSGDFDLSDLSDGSNTYNKDVFKTIDPDGNRP